MTIQSLQPIQFAGTPEVKKNLVMAAQASANFLGTKDRFNLGQVQQAVTAAMIDPAFREVMENPQGLLDEAFELPGQGKATLAETLQSRGALRVLHDAMRETMMANPEGPDTLDISLKVKNPVSLRTAMGEKPTVVVRKLFKAMMDNAFKLDGPLSETHALIEGFCDALDMQLNSLGLDDLPIFKKQPPVEGQWADGE